MNKYFITWIDSYETPHIKILAANDIDDAVSKIENYIMETPTNRLIGTCIKECDAQVYYVDYIEDTHIYWIYNVEVLGDFFQ